MIVKNTGEYVVSRFLLLQGGVVLDKASTPSFLRYSRVDENRDFQVAVGSVDGDGKRKIIGVVANAIPRPGYTSVRISSEVDDHWRRVGATHSLGELVRQRLSLYWRKGLFKDIPHLPKTVVVIGIE
jgi:hypothetical protein